METPIDKVLDSLRARGGKVIREGDEWKACCPAHDDHKPSLGIKEGADGKVLLICRSAGCTTKQIASSLGMAERDLFPSDPHAPSKNGSNSHSKTEPERDWLSDSQRYADALTPDLKKKLAIELRLPVEALDRVDLIGWMDSEKCWTFPERCAAGGIVGITRRFESGDKRMIANGKRGLTIPHDWRETTGPLFLVEGASDVLAMSFCGLAAIGRPSNRAGIDALAELLKGTTRDVVVVGENDRKADGTWPGRDGATATAKALGNMIDRPIRWALPPEEYKDVRKWVNDLADGAADENPYPTIGQTIRAELEKGSKGEVSRFEFISSAKFASGDFRPEWLINKILVAKQPGVIAGPSKALKTSVSIDLAVSLASGLDFLGTFKVPRRARIAVVSGESGQHTLQETAMRVCRSKKILLDDLDGYLDWCFNLPTFSDLAGMKEFAKELTKLDAEVTILDPLYLALGAIDARNMFEAGNAFRVMTETLHDAGSMPLIVHHSNKQLPIGEPMELAHLAYAGLEQFARQFILLNRRVKYQGDGAHDLWATIGGSAGHGGLWNLLIREGVVDESFAGREWNISVKSRSEVQDSEEDRKETVKREADSKRNARDEAAILSTIDIVTQNFEGATQHSIKDATAMRTDRLKKLIESLIESEVIEEVEFKKEIGSGVRRNVIGYRRTQNHENHRG